MFIYCSNKGVIPGTKHRVDECEKMANQLRQYWPQFDLDGIKNLWIVKPGAKSRGRGKDINLLFLRANSHNSHQFHGLTYFD